MIAYNGKVRLTAKEAAALRKKAARKGAAVGQIRTDEDHLAALMLAAPQEPLKRLLEDFETFCEHGSSPLTRGELSPSSLSEPPSGAPPSDRRP